MLAEAVARDMEEVAINGDTASADPFLATMDGVLKQATSHVVDAAAASLYRNRGVAYLRMGFPDTAKEDFTASIAIGSRPVPP